MINPSGSARRAFALLGSAIFLLLAPGTVVGYIPWRISHWQVHASFPGLLAVRSVGVLLIAAGLPVLLESFARFALHGLGTPAPVFPTNRLVVTGFYRFVRNPMYVAVVSMILGQSLFFADLHVLEYAAIAWLVAHLFVLFYEEPTLRKSYGAQYANYCAHVGRWIPRLTPWHGAVDSFPSTNSTAAPKARHTSLGQRPNSEPALSSKG